MRRDELKELILSGESSTVEFKRKINSPKKLAKELSAFANTRGGHLLIGVDDDGTVVGVPSEKDDDDAIERACAFYLNPPIIPETDIVNLYYKDVVVISVSESPEKPHMLLDDPEDPKSAGKTYIRVGERSVIASKEMARVLRAQNPDSPPVRIVVGDMEKRLFGYLKSHERATVQDFQKLVNISRRRAERLMVRLVKAGVLQIHFDSQRDYFTLV